MADQSTARAFMLSRAEIESAWNAHYFRAFPHECAGREVDGVCLTSCDTFLAGCISYFVENGTLDPERSGIVSRVCADLERVMPLLSGDAHRYFSELLALGKALEVRANAR
jgi:hypothetical protein